MKSYVIHPRFDSWNWPRSSEWPVRQECSRRDRSTSFSKHRRTPYRRHDSNNDDRGRDWYRSTVITPDTYSGDDDWEQYISHFEDCNWSQKEKILNLVAKRKDQAHVFYRSLPATDKRSYWLLVAMLEQRFGSTRLWFDFCFTALQHILGHFRRGQLT